MEPECSLRNTQALVTSHYPKPARSSSYPTSHFLKIHLNIIIPSADGSPKLLLSLRFPHQNPARASPLPHTRHTPRHLILLDFITRTNILLKTIFLNNLSLRCSLKVSDEVSHTYIQKRVTLHCRIFYS